MILEGFLDYRTRVHSLGFVAGFQWLNGSFTENIEVLASRPPEDIDVVNFTHQPLLPMPPDADMSVLEHGHAKSTFKVDAYWIELDILAPRSLAALSAYWYSMWSHSRTQDWKGFLQIELDPNDDAQARSRLAAIRDSMGVPS